MWNCTQCGNRNLSAATVCDQCGAPGPSKARPGRASPKAAPSDKCPWCPGNPETLATRNCGHCGGTGKAIKKTTVPEVPATNASKNPEKLRWSAIAIILFSLLMPWLQVSCAGESRTATGLHLLRGGDPGQQLQDRRNDSELAVVARDFAKPRIGLAFSILVVVATAFLAASWRISKNLALGLAALAAAPSLKFLNDVSNLRAAGRGFLLVEIRLGFWIFLAGLAMFAYSILKTEPWYEE